MKLSPCALGAAAALAGAGLILPVFVARLESADSTGPMVTLVATGVALIVLGAAGVFTGYCRRPTRWIPPGVRAAVAADAVFLAFFALEFSDGLVRQHGRLLYWNSFLFVPALLLLYGLLSARRWAWWTSRAFAGAAATWFLAFAVIVPFVDLRSNGLPTPWQGRIYMICLSLVLAAIPAAAFLSLGRSDSRQYFGLSATLNPKIEATGPSSDLSAD